jgi:hypothetical protein
MRRATIRQGHHKFYAEESCRTALPKIIGACESASYTFTDDLQSIGTSIGEASESEAAQDRYLATAQQTTNQIRDDIFGSLKSPISSASHATSGGPPVQTSRGMRAGRCCPTSFRRWTKGGHANPHIDQLRTPLLDPTS